MEYGDAMSLGVNQHPLSFEFITFSLLDVCTLFVILRDENTGRRGVGSERKSHQELSRAVIVTFSQVVVKDSVVVFMQSINS